MIEIAISLAVIGFALVAIIGILPIGLDTQKLNREETVINQDASLLLEAIRNGNQGMDDLTNYVIAITNYVTIFQPNPNGGVTPRNANPRVDGYTPDINRTAYGYAITNGYRIIGLLSTPKYTYHDEPPGPTYAFNSNYIVAYVRSMSGAAFEKAPQDNQLLKEASLTYRLISEVVPYYYSDPNWVDPRSGFYLGDTYTNTVHMRELNLSDIRLIFRWPVLPNGNIGGNRLVFRTEVSGSITNKSVLTQGKVPPPAYFFNSRNYVRNGS